MNNSINSMKNLADLSGKILFSILAIFSLLSITGMAQTTVPSSTPTYGIDLTACRYTFDWDQYIADQRANRTASNPYTSQGCVRQNGLNTTNGSKYSDFEVGQPNTKQAFGDDPVLGIFPNNGFAAQSINTYNTDGSVDGSKAVANRALVSNLGSIFTTDQLSQIYSTGGAQTGAPRIFSTGPDQYYTNSQDQRVYQGGWCKVENGNIVVRTTRDGNSFDASLYGRNPNDPSTSCARTVNGNRLPAVEDRNIQAYQFLYEFKYPTAAQCNDFFNVDETTCKTFFEGRYGGDLAGKTEGNRIISTYTYYGTFDDAYSQWVGWVNPDINSPRKNAADAFLRGYDGFSVYSLN